MKFANVLFEKDNIPNIKAIMNGRQIILCKKPPYAPLPYKDSDIVFLVSSTKKGVSDINLAEQGGVNFLRSSKGDKILEDYGDEQVKDTNVVVKCSDIKLKLEGPSKEDKLRNFFTELYKLDLFSLWDIEYGPLRYFENTNECYLRFYRAYNITVKAKQEDYKLKGSYAPPIIKDEETENRLLEKINDIDDIYSSPVLSDNEFDNRKNKVFQLIRKHGLSEKKYIDVEPEQPLQRDNIRKLLDLKKQIILYGPPGTGKTYSTKKMATDLLESN